MLEMPARFHSVFPIYLYFSHVKGSLSYQDIKVRHTTLSQPIL